MKAVRIISALIAVVALASLLAPAAQAGSPIKNFEVKTSSTQAGGHPDLYTVLQFGNRATQHIPPPTCDCQDPRDFTIRTVPARFAELGDLHHDIDDHVFDLAPLLEWADRDDLPDEDDGQ